MYSVLGTSEKMGMNYKDESLYESNGNYRRFRKIDSLKKRRMRERQDKSLNALENCCNVVHLTPGG